MRVLGLFICLVGIAHAFTNHHRSWATTLEQYSFADPLKQGLVEAVGFTGNTEAYMFPTHTANFTPACNAYPPGIEGFEITFRVHAADQVRLVQWGANGLRFQDGHRERPHMVSMGNAEWISDALNFAQNVVLANWFLFRKPPEILSGNATIVESAIWGLYNEPGQPFSTQPQPCPGTLFLWPPAPRTFSNTASIECDWMTNTRQTLLYVYALFGETDFQIGVRSCNWDVPAFGGGNSLINASFQYDTAYQMSMVWGSIVSNSTQLFSFRPKQITLTMAGPNSSGWPAAGLTTTMNGRISNNLGVYQQMRLEYGRPASLYELPSRNFDFDLMWTEIRRAEDAGLVKTDWRNVRTWSCADVEAWMDEYGQGDFNNWVGNCSTDLWDTYLAWTPNRQPACTQDVDVLVNQGTIVDAISYEADWNVSNPHNDNNGNSNPQNEINVPARSSHVPCVAVRLWEHCEDYDVVQLTKAGRQADIDEDEYTSIITIHNVPNNGTLWNMCNTSHPDAQQFTLDPLTGLHQFEANQTFYYLPDSSTQYGVDIDQIVFFAIDLNAINHTAKEEHLIVYSSWDVRREQLIVNDANPGFTTWVVQALAQQVRGPNSTLHIDMDPIIPDVNANGTITIGDVIYIPAGKCHRVDLKWSFPTNSSYNATIHISGQGRQETFWNNTFPYIFETYEGCRTTNLSQVAPFAEYRDDSGGPIWTIELWIRLPIQTFEALEQADASPLFWIHAGWEHEGLLTANYTVHAGFISPVFIGEDLAFPDRICIDISTPEGTLLDNIQDVDVHTWSIGNVTNDFNNDGFNSVGPIVNYVEVVVAPRAPFGLHDPDDNLLVAGDIIPLDELNATTIHLHLAFLVPANVESDVGTLYQFQLVIVTCSNVTDVSVQPGPFLVCIDSETYEWQFGLAAEMQPPAFSIPSVWVDQYTWIPEWQNELETLVGVFRFYFDVPDFEPTDIVAFEFQFDAGLGDTVWFPLAVDANQSLVYTNFGGNPFEDVDMTGDKRWSTTLEIAQLMLSQTEFQLAFGFDLAEQFLTVWAGDEFGEFPGYTLSSPFICTSATTPSTNTSFWLGTRGSFLGGNDLNDMVYPDIILIEDGELRQTIFGWNVATVVVLSPLLVCISFSLCGFAAFLDPVKLAAETTLPNFTKRKNKNE